MGESSVEMETFKTNGNHVDADSTEVRVSEMGQAADD